MLDIGHRPEDGAIAPNGEHQRSIGREILHRMESLDPLQGSLLSITAQQIRLYTDGIPMGAQLLKDGGEQRVVFYLIFLRIYSNLHDVLV